MEFCPVPEEELHKSSMELDPVVLLCHVSREDAEVAWYDFREQIPNLLFWVLFFILTFLTKDKKKCNKVSCLGFLRYKDGCEIQPGDNITLQAEGTLRRLIIRSAETSDAGSYTCQAGNNNIEFIVNVRGTEPVLTHSLFKHTLI